MTTAADNLAVAAELAKALAAHDRLVAAEGKRLGDKYSVQHAKAAREQIEVKDSELAKKDFDLQRAAACIAELREQMTHLDRITAQHNDLVRRVTELADTARKIGEGVPAAMLTAAITNARNASYATATKEN